MNHKNSPGYVLVFSLMMIALIVILVTRIADIGNVHIWYSKTIIDREHAKMLAWSGVNIALSQLSISGEEKKEAGNKNQREKKRKDAGPKMGWTEGEAKNFIKNIVPLLNSWQIFDIKKETYGVDGTIKVCIGSEEGKIDINQSFDFKTRKFIGQGKREGNFKKLFEQLFKRIEKFVVGKELFKKFSEYLTKKEKFEQILKNRQNSLYDPTEFLSIKEFEVFQDAVFYEPYNVDKIKNNEVTGAKKEKVYWMDIFTIWSGSRDINPWFFSNSMKRIIGIKFKENEKIENKKKKINGLLKHFKLDLSLPADWNKIFSTLYNVKYNNLPNWIKKAMSAKFEPAVFSVLSYGTVGSVTQKLFAVLERKKIKQDKKIVVKFDVKKFYWL